MPLLQVLEGQPASEVEIVDRLDDGRVVVRFVSVDSVMTVPAHLLVAAAGERELVTASARRTLNAAQLKVLESLHRAGPFGMTDDEHEAVNGLKADSAGVRRKELERQLLVVDTGDIRPTRRGSRARVWRITTLGEQTLRELHPSLAG